MNIEKAKEQIRYAVKSYFTKDEDGHFIIPIERQRPIFLMGPPGVGKTAIMEQIASELGVGLVTYSMTHHTRQSALGLPFITTKTFNGKEYSVSEYTMSEIIATVYDKIENYGAKEGILFLDEINCVSETLAPSMLQFLQYKIFGTHRVPDGWIVVTAGNPPEYNNSVREFDIVTWDRLKRIDVEPDFEVWKNYAYSKNVHPAVITYLEIKKSDFYKIETTVDGKSFVTARGWVDLSDMIKLYEKNDFEVDVELIKQYLQNKKIANDFANYYKLFKKYKSDYQIDKILAGNPPENIVDRAKNAQFDERISLLGLIFSAMNENTSKFMTYEKVITELMNSIKSVKAILTTSNPGDSADKLKSVATEIEKKAEKQIAAGMISYEDQKVQNRTAEIIREMANKILEDNPSDGKAAFEIIKTIFNNNVTQMKKDAEDVKKKLNNALIFCNNAFGAGQEMVIIVTEMTASSNCAQFISHYGCEEYFKYNKELLITERQREIEDEIDNLNLD